MKKEKTRNDVKGAIIGCPYFSSCPICYGCRAYSTTRKECELCAENRKYNICDTSKHKPGPVSQLISRNKINL